MTDAPATPATPATTLGVRAVLRIRDFRHLISGQIVSDIGDGITLLLLMLVINELTGSTFALALMAIAEGLPQMTVGLAAGVYVDRWDRRRVMLASDLLRAAIVAGYAVVALTGIVPLLYLLGFAHASVSTFFRPARAALLPHIVPDAGLPAANSLAQTSLVIGSVVGAGIAGLVFGLFGTGTIGFVIDAATFLVSFAFVSRIAAAAGRVTGTQSQNVRPPFRRSLAEGLAVIRGSRLLTGAILAATVTMLGFGAVNVLIVPFIIDDLRVPATWMAGVELAQTVGMILAAGFVAALAARLAPTTIIAAGLAGLGICIAVLSGVDAAWQMLGLLFVAGLILTPLQAMLQTVVQTQTADAALGRVASLMSASVSTAGVVSMAVGGLLGDVIGVRWVFVAAGALAVLASLVAVLLFRGSRSTAAPEAPGPMDQPHAFPPQQLAGK
ncbi:MAG TPA: MFS transporter [Candidatus Limnocylindria bacterium]|nr:MFS transporter [Candidatus Limnocylindria bacterium]